MVAHWFGLNFIMYFSTSSKKESIFDKFQRMEGVPVPGVVTASIEYSMTESVALTSAHVPAVVIVAFLSIPQATVLLPSVDADIKSS